MIYIDIRAAENGYTARINDYPKDGKRIDARVRTFIAADVAALRAIVSEAIGDALAAPGGEQS